MLATLRGRYIGWAALLTVLGPVASPHAIGADNDAAWGYQVLSEIVDVQDNGGGVHPDGVGQAPPARAPALETLLPGLEAKVNANPRDVDARLLLARTYVELGRRERGLNLLHELYTEYPSNTDIAVAYGYALAAGGDGGERDAAIRVFDDIAARDPDQAGLVRLYQGRALQEGGMPQAAARVLHQALRSPDAADGELRDAIEAALAGTVDAGRGATR